MHSTDAPSGLVYRHNGDFSGNIQVTLPWAKDGDAEYGVTATDMGERQSTVEIPFADLEMLVLERVRLEMIGDLESATHDELRELLHLRTATRG